ncbi:MAG: ADP-ribosylation factor-like protein [Candidatus Hodarchaeales archaeon]|jgi:GTPase SAR1 family protein
MPLTQIHFYRILSLLEFDMDERKPSPEEILQLPIKRLRGLDETEGAKLEEIMGFRTIEDLVRSTAAAAEIVEKTQIPEPKVNRWLRMSRLLRNLTSGKITTPKVILAGLDNAGKTSISLTLRRIADRESKKNRLKQIGELKPTKGVERQEVTIHGQPMLLFDLGGQKTYRERYLESPERYIGDVDLVFFVIDVHDQDRYPEAAAYFESLAYEIYNLRLNPAFALFFHKMDKKLPDDSELWKVMENQVSLFQAVLREVWKNKPIPSLTSEMIFESSIMREISVFSGVSKGLKAISPVQDILQGSVNEAAKTLDSDLLLLVADNGLELARFQSTNADYLLDEPPNFLYKETLNKLPDIEEKSAIHPILGEQEGIYHIITATVVEEKPIYLSYLSAVDTAPEQEQIDQIIGDSFLPWVANYFEQM